MEISSNDRKSFLRMERKSPNRSFDRLDYFHISASVNEFSASNDGILIVGSKQFLRALDVFDERRQGEVILEGTEDFRLGIRAFDNAGHLEIFFRICKYGAGARLKPLEFRGSFGFDSESANQLFRELRNVLADLES